MIVLLFGSVSIKISVHFMSNYASDRTSLPFLVNHPCLIAGDTVKPMS